MKRILTSAILTIIIALLIIGYNKSNEYEMSGKVYQVTNEHWVLIETDDGNMWEVDDYTLTEGQKVIVTLNSRDTPNKRDDKVIKVASR